MAAAARAAAERGVWAMCGFTYRRTPLAPAGWSGRADRSVRQVRAQYLQDWLHDPDAPMTWRLDKSMSGPARWGPRRPPGRHRPMVDRPEITGVSAILETREVPASER